MRIESEIIKALKPKFTQADETLLDPVQQNAFHLRTSPPYFIKWIPENDTRGNNEIWVNQNILANAKIPTPKLVCTAKTENATIICWEWLEGTDLRLQHRDKLPEAFALLGAFHAEYRCEKSGESLVTRRIYKSPGELIAADLEFLCSLHDTNVYTLSKKILKILEEGFPTYIHGDMHPGNIRSTRNGLKIVDWGYCQQSLNFFDLGYIQSEDLVTDGSDPWWNITPAETGKVLPGYYASCELSHLDPYQVQHAVMLWSELWSYSNAIKNGIHSGAEIAKQNIARLIRS